nr:exodeoxyribonuclease VII large subunit [Aestuariispira insulae]
MDLFDAPPEPKAEKKPASNLPELTVTELSLVLKRTVEDAFSYVRLRGEISGFKRAASGHMYMALKDTDSVIDGICWRGQASKLSVLPEDGLEVVVTGKLTTYPGRSKYQIVIESMELAGEGALLKLLEERRKKLAAEGLFAEERKRPLPFLPQVIGVVTSPTGAVIRDILHRLKDRFPRHVLLWPVMVQGEGAAEQVARAIAGFNRLPDGGKVPRPDLLIVARGGGSLEDLWAFNEEVVVRAAAASEIPLISAVGHETDTTLIDFASDRRAPTPTAAAEMAVPVRTDLIAMVKDMDRRAISGLNRQLQETARHLEGLGRGLPKPDSLLQVASQRLDDYAERLGLGWQAGLRSLEQRTALAGSRLRSPREVLDHKAERLAGLGERLNTALNQARRQAERRYEDRRLGERLDQAFGRIATDGNRHLERLDAQLEALSYQNVLKRGYAVVRDENGQVISTAEAAHAAGNGSVGFQDGGVDVVFGAGSFADVITKRTQPKPKAKAKKTEAAKPDEAEAKPENRQGSLL